MGGEVKQSCPSRVSLCVAGAGGLPSPSGVASAPHSRADAAREPENGHPVPPRRTPLALYFESLGALVVDTQRPGDGCRRG